jgi:hypothetical protein
VVKTQLTPGAETSGICRSFFGDKDGVLCATGNEPDFYKAAHRSRAETDTGFVTLVIADETVVLKQLRADAEAQLPTI